MLGQAFGKEDCRHYHLWMFHYIHIIISGKEYFGWAQIMSDNIHEQIRNVLETEKFFMTYYAIWVVARSGIYPGLNTSGRLREAPEEVRAWEYYTHFPIQQVMYHFKKINDVFIYAVICRLIGDVGYRLPLEAMKLVQELGTCFIQNQ